MTESRKDPEWIATTAKRFRGLYAAVVYDIMDEMGLPNQCLDLGIAPLDNTMQVAGPAYTLMAGPDMRARDEIPPNPKMADFAMFTHMYEGCVVIVAAAGEQQSGVWGELLSNASRARGATGVVIDGGIRDTKLLREIDNWSVFSRYTSPIESLHRTRIRDLEVPIAMSGTLTSQLRVNPGDWVFGDEDGVVVVPQHALDEVLAKSEEAKDIEDKVRAEVRNGVSVSEVFQKYGRL